MAERDSLNQRVRDVLLFDNYGQRLTEKQRLACEMILSGIFRSRRRRRRSAYRAGGFTTLVARAREHMEEYEASFGLAALRRRLEAMERVARRE